MRIFTQQILSSAFAFSIACAASAQDAPALAWGKMFDGGTKSGDQSIAVAVAPDNSVYWMNTLASHSDEEYGRDVFFGGVKLFEGAPYEGTSVNNNLAITKTDADGNVLWTVYSTSGDFANSQGGIAIGPDGSVYFAAKVRHTAGMPDKDMSLTFTDDEVYNFGGTISGTDNYFIGIYGKIKPQGTVEYLGIIEPGHNDSDGKNVADALTINGVTLDAEGKLYIAGSCKMPVNIYSGAEKANVGFRGDENGKNENLFIAQVGTSGIFSGALTAAGTALPKEQIASITFSDGKLYISGFASATEATDITLGGKTISVNDVNTPFIASVSTADLSVDWVTAAPGEKVDNANAIQNTSVSVADGNVWYTGMFNGKFTFGDKVLESTQSKQREGLIGKFDAATGSCLAIAGSREGFSTDAVLGGYLASFSNPAEPSNIYVYGYLMNKDHGTFLRTYKTADLTPDTDHSWDLVSGGGAPIAVSMAYDDTLPALFCTTRGNQAFSPLGGEESDKPSFFGIYATRFDLPEALFSGVDNVSTAATAAGVKVYGGNGVLRIAAAADTTVSIYDLAGRAAATVTVNGGSEASVPLPAGIYIAAGIKAVVR